MTTDTKQAATILTDVFTTAFALYAKAHSYHVNVVGRDFFDIHELLGDVYEDTWKSLDVIAERIRAIGEFGPSAFPAVTVLPGGTTMDDLLKDVMKDQQQYIERLHTAIDELTDLHDLAGADTLTGLLAEQEKYAWMLKATTTR